MRAPSRLEWLALLGVLALSVTLRCYNLHVPLVDTSDWRQTDTAAVAYFFFHQGIHLLHPQLWHDGPGPDYTQLELQISPAIAAALAHVFGFSDTLLRVVALSLFTLAAVPLWALCRRHFGPRVAIWTALCYVLLPVGIFFGRAFQPEPAQICFGMIGLWAVDRWAVHRTPARYGLACIALALAVLAKLPNGMLLPAAAALAYQDVLWRWREMFSARRLWPVAAMQGFAVGAAAAYTLGQAAIASGAGGTKYVNFIVLSLADSYIAGANKLTHFAWHNVLGMAVTPGGGALAILGIVALTRRGRSADWVWAWTAGVLCYAVVVLRAIRFQYYLMPILPWLALLMGAGLDLLCAEIPAALPRVLRALPGLAGAMLVASILTGGLFEIQGYWPPYMFWYRAGRQLDLKLPAHTTVILTGTYNPTLLYYARRHGYRVNPLTMSLLQADYEGGARYVIDQGGIDPCMSAYLAANFDSEDIGGLTVWALTSPPPSPGPAFDTGNCAQ